MDLTKQREAIRSYMERHTQPPFEHEHPFAASCACCKWKLDKSPVKSDPDAPPCRWAKGKQTLAFDAVTFEAPKEGAEPWALPWCRQYAPQAAWHTIVWEPDSDSMFDEGICLALLKSLATSANANVYSVQSRAFLQWLTGRPEKASTNHRDTFLKRLAAEKDDLNLSQLWTLLHWGLLDWERMSRHVKHVQVPTFEYGYRTGLLVDFHWLVYQEPVLPAPNVNVVEGSSSKEAK